MIKIAIPNKGSLSDDAIQLITEAGYRCKKGIKELVMIDPVENIEFYFLRPRDIAVYVGNGLLELGITGRDLLIDSGANTVELLALNFGRASFYYAAPKDTTQALVQLSGKRIATSYPYLVDLDLKKRGITASIVKLDGAVEISIKLGVADAIADVVQSGSTLKEAGLATIGDPILVSEAICIAHGETTIKSPEVALFIRRLKGIITAREFVIIEYDIPKTVLEKACAITPGIESPTISPLSNTLWVAVKAMVKKSETNIIMDQLMGIGAKGIIVTDIRTCRI